MNTSTRSMRVSGDGRLRDVLKPSEILRTVVGGARDTTGPQMATDGIQEGG